MSGEDPNRRPLTLPNCPPSFSGSLNALRDWSASADEPSGSRRRATPAQALLPPLQLRPADSGRRHAVLRPDVSGVRSHLGTGHSATAVRQSGATEAVGDVLGDRAGGRPVSVRPSVLFALAQQKMLWRNRRRVARDLAEAFNRQAGTWWSELHRAAKTRADRATGFKGKLATRVWEKQKRGLAHLHGVVSVESPAHRQWAEAYMNALRELAPRYGFGYVDGWHKVGRKFWPGIQAAAYLSSYLIGGRHRKAQITENVLASDLPRLVVFVGRDLTRSTGCTMRTLRHGRRLWASRNLYADPPRVTLEEWLAAAGSLSARNARPARAP
jgi:hypothetical protein